MANDPLRAPAGWHGKYESAAGPWRRPAVAPLWAHLGWAEVRGDVTYTDSNGEARAWPLVAMVRPLAEQPWPGGDVDLGGLPF